MSRVGRMIRAIAREGNASAFSQSLECFRKRDAPNLHEKLKNIAADSATKAVVNSFIRAD